jgi:hypothetical protein
LELNEVIAWRYEIAQEEHSLHPHDEDVQIIKRVHTDITSTRGHVFNHDPYKTEVRESLFVPNQKGAFACENIPKGSIVTWYSGAIYRELENLDEKIELLALDDPKASLYCYDVRTKQNNGKFEWRYCIDGYVPDPVFGGSERCIGTYFNHEYTKPNCKFHIYKFPKATCIFQHRAAIVAVCDIAKDTEFTLNYGHAYHQQLLQSGNLCSYLNPISAPVPTFSPSKEAVKNKIDNNKSSSSGIFSPAAREARALEMIKEMSNSLISGVWTTPCINVTAKNCLFQQSLTCGALCEINWCFSHQYAIVTNVSNDVIQVETSFGKSIEFALPSDCIFPVSSFYHLHNKRRPPPTSEEFILEKNKLVAAIKRGSSKKLKTSANTK